MTVTLVAGLKRAFGRDHDGVLYECRRCGTNVDAEADQCPACGTPDIARYEIQ